MLKSPSGLIRKPVFHTQRGASLLFALRVINCQLPHLNSEDRMFLGVLFTLKAIKSNSEGVKFSVVIQPS